MTTATTPKGLEGMVALGQGSKVKLLGYITWFSIPEIPVSISKLRKAWMMAGLDPSPLPKDQRAANVFQRAMREQEGRVTNGDGTITQTDVVDVLQSAEEIVYQVSRVERDLEGKVVNYPKALQVVFNKEHQSLSYKALDDTPAKDVLPMMHAISDYYEGKAKTITGRKLRGVVRDFIKDDSHEQSGVVGLSGQNLRGQAGGVYFVLQQYGEQLDGISQALTDLYPDGRAYLYAIPLADGATERELIRRHHVANTLDDAKKAIATVSDILRDDRLVGVRSDVASHHWGKLQGMKRRVKMYTAALKEEEAEVDGLMTMLERQLKKLPGA